MNKLFPAPLIETLERLERAMLFFSFLSAQEFRTVKHPYMGVDVSISKNRPENEK